MSPLPTWKGKKRRAGSKKGKKGQKGKKRRKTTKSSTRRKPSYEDGETAPFWNTELEEVYARLPMPAMAQGASTAADLASGCSSHDGRKWSTWCSRRIVENKPLEPGVRARVHWRDHVAFPKDVTVVSAETVAEAKTKKHEQKQKCSNTKRAKQGLSPVTLPPEKELKVRKLRVRLGVEPREDETRKQCKDRQEGTLREWAGACRFTYNKALASTREKDPKDPENKNWIPMPLDVSLLRQRFTQEEATKENAELAKKCAEHAFTVGELVEKHKWLKNTPAHMRSEAIRDLHKAHTSNIAKAKCERERRKQHMAEGRPAKLCQKVHSWKLRFKRRGDMSSWTLALSTECISNVTIADRPEGRAKHVDDPPQRRRKWTRLKLPYNFGALWLTEEVPRGAIVPYANENSNKLKFSSACRLTRDPCGGWFLHVPFPEEEEKPKPLPEEKPPPRPKSERRIIALDPGECIFQSGYSVDHTIAYGNKAEDDQKKARLEAAHSAAVAAYNAAKYEGTPTETKRHHNRVKGLKAKLRWCPGNGGANRLWALSEKIDSLLKARKVLLMAFKVEQEPTRRKVNVEARHEVTHQIQHLRRKLRNLVDDAHKKIALDLARHYDTILIPSFPVKQMVMRENDDGRRRCLRSQTVRSLLNWAHYRFRMFLQHKAIEHGKEVVVCTEKYTSKACGKCGCVNGVQGREYRCKHATKGCGHIGHRDGCAARNILLQYVIS